MTASDRIVIVGAGHAGTTLAARLRQSGHTGVITMISDEPTAPYQRPPLSKRFLADDHHQPMRDDAFYDEQLIDLILDDTVIAVDRENAVVETSRGRVIGYRHLVLATGAAPRSLPVPGSDLNGVLTLRTIQDCAALRDGVARGKTVCVVGGGYVGLEVASVLTGAGHQVSVVERESRLLSRTASPALASILHDQHARRGTRILTDSDVERFEGRDSELTGLVLTDARTIDCEVAVVGVGATPRDQLARAVGLTCTTGVVVDDRATTSDPRILAIGDVTCRPVGGLADPRRLESIPSATEQARQATATILGLEPPAPEVPWFWSDQLDLKLKIAGIVHPDLESVVRGDPDTGRFAVFSHRDGVVHAVETSNSAAEFMAGRRLVASGRRIEPQLAANPATDLRHLMSA